MPGGTDCFAIIEHAALAPLIQSLHPQCVQRAVVFDLNAQRHRTATDLAILDVLLGARADFDARLETLAAIWTGGGDELLGGDSAALCRRLKDGLKSIQAVDMPRLEACDPACEGFYFRILATGHRAPFYTAAELHAESHTNEVAALNAAHTRLPLLAALLLGAILGACGGAGRLADNTPAGVDLSGTWRLNRALSDDPEKLYEKFRQQRAIRNGEQAPPAANRGARRGNSPYPADDPTSPAALAAETQAAANRSHLNPYDMGVFGTIPRGDLVTIRQSADEFYISDGLADRGFTPGAQSVVSVPEGVADQHSGWKSKQYVIDVKAQAGPETVESYRLSADGKQLLAEIHSTGGNMPSMKIKRVYERASAVPSAAPTND
jgi:hypothetical protein